MRDPSEGSLKRRSGGLPTVIAQTDQIVLVSKLMLNEISHRRCMDKAKSAANQAKPERLLAIVPVGMGLKPGAAVRRSKCVRSR